MSLRNKNNAAHNAAITINQAELISSLSPSESRFLGSFEYALENKKIQLPILPKIAISVRQMAASKNCDAQKLAKLIKTDPVLSSRLLQVANSAALNTGTKITNPQFAITRLGLSATSQIVTTLSLEGLFRARSLQAIKGQLVSLWQHNCRVAAISHVIAHKFTPLKPEQAMLCGLLHDIGKLPILLYCQTNPSLAPSKEEVDNLLDKLHPYIGGLLLEHWELPAEIVAVAKEHEILNRHTEGAMDYVDIVTVANLYSYLGQKGHKKKINWKEVVAFEKLGLTPSESIEALNAAKAELQDIERILS